ncbi:hypothetical protein [Aquimonas sp.]|jgi:hypothetical protein|uniref:hypothetical protein n=1 Tax=Aquimonas sp. TaxID=1872588 RepID=UPI0037BEB024
MNYVLPAGPFAGTVVCLHALVQTDDGKALLWPISERYPLFRSLFPAEVGWSLTTVREHLAEKVPAYDDFGLAYRSGDQPMLFPAMLITATLRDPTGRVVADASSLIEIGARKAYEMGENNARSRLFESLGLPAAFDARLFTPGAAELMGAKVTVLPSGANGGAAARSPRLAVVPVAAAEIQVAHADFHRPTDTTVNDPVVVTEVVLGESPTAVHVPTLSHPTTSPKATVPNGLSAVAISRAQQAAARAGSEFQVENFKSNAELMAFAANVGEQARKAKSAKAGAA